MFSPTQDLVQLVANYKNKLDDFVLVHNNYTSAKISEEVAKAKKQKTEEVTMKLKQKHETLEFSTELQR